MTPRDNINPEVIKESAAIARKRRIELRNMQRVAKESDDLTVSSDAESRRSSSDDLEFDPITLKPKPLLTGIKQQHRYVPGVTMTRDELKAWRKEARRVRNRESAAASRKRNRERISELEVEVDVLQSKYTAALQRIMQLESGSINDSFTPEILRQDLSNLVTTDRQSESPYSGPVKTVSPPMSPLYASRRISDVDEHDEDVNRKYQHIIDVISRPAVST